MNKKISVGLTITVAALAAAIAFFAGGSIVRGKVNQTLIDINEKQAMYSKLYELDQCIRANKEDDIDEKALSEGICSGYIEGLNDPNFTYVTAEELAEIDASDGNIKVIKLSDGSAVIIDSASAEDGENGAAAEN